MLFIAMRTNMLKWIIVFIHPERIVFDDIFFCHFHIILSQYSPDKCFIFAALKTPINTNAENKRKVKTILYDTLK